MRCEHEEDKNEDCTQNSSNTLFVTTMRPSTSGIFSLSPSCLLLPLSLYHPTSLSFSLSPSVHALCIIQYSCNMLKNSCTHFACLCFFSDVTLVVVVVVIVVAVVYLSCSSTSSFSCSSFSGVVVVLLIL